jgi:5-methylcytosine-specific restriction enzyme A
MSDKDLVERAKHARKKPGKREVITTYIERDSAISEYVKRRANGICDLCGQAAPFIKENGDPYLETHHIIHLANNGDDSIENTVALCPNCHRKMHSLNLESDVKILKNKYNNK